jgi:hypothetical protein
MWQEWETCIQDFGGKSIEKGPLARHSTDQSIRLKWILMTQYGRI